MRVLFLLFLVLPCAAIAQPKWEDCATEDHYSIWQKGNWQEVNEDVKFCYDTHAFAFKAGKKSWYTGIVHYTQHLEEGYLVEEFTSEGNKKYPKGELRFHIVRGTPATITITSNITKQSWQIRSTKLGEVKLGK